MAAGRGLNLLMTRIPTLITLDVHAHPRLKFVLSQSAEFFSAHGLRVTYFVPSGFIVMDRLLGPVLQEIKKLGHAIGCHGLNHTPEEDFRGLVQREQFAILRQATQILEDTLGTAVKTFRAPQFSLSKNTLSILAQLGYQADLSVTPQRLAFLSSTPWSLAGMRAPRSPYRPHRSSPYRRGDLPILEIPTTSLLVPLGRRAMTLFRSRGIWAICKTLIWEAGKFDRVLVVNIHPETIAGRDWGFAKNPLRWSDFVPRAQGGMQIRNRFGNLTREHSKQLAMELVRQLETHNNLDLMSLDDYIKTPAFCRHFSSMASGCQQTLRDPQSD
jgi:peptidoglycan/xylan/chitin deacetylase (PgdA/CDA1 family)